MEKSILTLEYKLKVLETPSLENHSTFFLCLLIRTNIDAGRDPSLHYTPQGQAWLLQLNQASTYYKGERYGSNSEREFQKISLTDLNLVLFKRGTYQDLALSRL